MIKEGKTGTLCFVTVSHRTEVDGTRCIVEQQDLVYRDDPGADAEATARTAPTDADVSETVTPSEVLLFRYSALTFNGHRIHYDRRYASDVEGYDGLVVHGPSPPPCSPNSQQTPAVNLRPFRSVASRRCSTRRRFRSTVAAPSPAWISGRPTPAAASP